MCFWVGSSIELNSANMYLPPYPTHRFAVTPEKNQLWFLENFRLPMKQSLVENNVTEPHEQALIMVVCWEENDSQIYCSINQIAESLSSSSIVNGMNLTKSLHTFILHSKTTPHKTVHGCHHQPTISHFYDPPPKKTSLSKVELIPSATKCWKDTKSPESRRMVEWFFLKTEPQKLT